MVQVVLEHSEGLTESLEVNNLSFAQETDWIADFRILYKTEDIIVGCAGFLLGGHIFHKICDGVSFGLEFAGIKRNAAGCLGPESGSVVHIVFFKSGCHNFFRSDALGQLINDGADHLKMSQFVGPEMPGAGKRAARVPAADGGPDIKDRRI